MLLSDVHEALGRILVLLFNGSRGGIYCSVVSFLRSAIANWLTLGQRYPVCVVCSIGILWSCLDLNCDPSSPTVQYLKRFILAVLLVVQPSVFNPTPNYPLHQALTRIDCIHSSVWDGLRMARRTTPIEFNIAVG